MDATRYNLTWNEIYIMIKDRRNFDIDYLDLRFYIITCEAEYLHDYIDWIEKECFYNGNNIIDNVFWEYRRFTRGRGKTRTAEMLWMYKDDEEKIALVLLMMCIWQALDNYPKNWGRKVKKIYEELRRVVFTRMKELNMELWHNNVRKPMPFSLSLEDKFCMMMVPKNIDDIIDIFTLEINYIFNKYQIVKCTDPTYEQRRKESLEKMRKMSFFK